MTEAAKELGQRQTEAEKQLWIMLKAKRFHGAKFRRQEPIGNYIVDFVNYENKLIIEVDGGPHNKTEVQINDTFRTLWLKSQGFNVLRFWNREILNNIEVVLEKIKESMKR